MSEETKSVGMEAFNVVKLSNEGVKMPLSLPDGTKTAEYLVVRGADSKEFRTHLSKANREKVKVAKLNTKDPAAADRKLAEINRELVATLVAGWSFPVECDKAHVVQFLADSPQIQKQVDDFAGNQANFFVRPPED